MKMQSVVRVATTVVLGVAVAACTSSGLGSGAWAWCKEHPAEVDIAAAGLQLPVAQTPYREPSWLPDYVTGVLNSSNALITANPAFVAACDNAADKQDVGETRISWCTTDGIGNVWDASIELGLMVDKSAETYAYKALPLSQRINNAEFVQACDAAYTARTSG
jgi:hypothetical protein